MSLQPLTSPEDGGNMFLTNVGEFSTNYVDGRTLHNHRCDSLKSYIGTHSDFQAQSLLFPVIYLQ
jgi:hypothetical protein